MNKELYLNKSIYNENIIRQGIRDYNSIAQFKFDEKTEYYIVSVISSCFDFEITFKEFENYLIGLLKKNGN